MKGWKGIRDGVVRIHDQEFTVKDWLQGLKEERWPKAWVTFWTHHDGFKDIDVE